MKTKVIIDAATDIYYSSFYINGLILLYGRNSIYFESTPFSQLKNRQGNLNFILKEGQDEKKYSISLDDTYQIKQDCYLWCDVYGCVNTNWNKTPEEYRRKLVSLAPSFGIRLWGLERTIYYGLLNYIKLHQLNNLKKHAGRYKRQYLLRLPINDYKVTEPEDNYIFHVSTLWQSDKWVRNDEYVNKLRSLFMDACKSINTIRFEGGFYYTGNHPLNQSFKHHLIKNFIPIDEYLHKIKKSVLVFNTPAWLDCHGWKLGEYLALGKAIISTPLANDLPEPLTHGENIHFVSDDPNEIKESIIYICRNRQYREKISKGAFEYFSKYASPTKSLGLMGIRN